MSVNNASALDRIIEHIGIRNGKLLSIKTIDQQGTQIRLYQANGAVFIVQVFPDGQGVEIFIPASRSLSIDTTLAKLDEYIDWQTGPVKQERAGVQAVVDQHFNL